MYRVDHIRIQRSMANQQSPNLRVAGALGVKNSPGPHDSRVFHMP